MISTFHPKIMSSLNASWCPSFLMLPNTILPYNLLHICVYGEAEPTWKHYKKKYAQYPANFIIASDQINFPIPVKTENRSVRRTMLEGMKSWSASIQLNSVVNTAYWHSCQPNSWMDPSDWNIFRSWGLWDEGGGAERGKNAKKIPNPEGGGE